MYWYFGDDGDDNVFVKNNLYRFDVIPRKNDTGDAEIEISEYLLDMEYAFIDALNNKDSTVIKEIYDTVDGIIEKYQ